MRNLSASCLLLAWSLAAGAPAPQPKAKKSGDKPSSLIGSWVLVQTETKGPDVVITFAEGGKSTWRDEGGSSEPGLYELRQGDGPPRVDIWPPARAVPGRPRKPPMLCVYKVEGDTLTIYYSNVVRPTALQKGDNPRIDELVLKRRK